MNLLRLYVRLLVLAWVYIAYTDGITAPLMKAGAGVVVTWALVRWFEKVAKHG